MHSKIGRVDMNNEERILTLLGNIQDQISSLEKSANGKFETMDRRFDSIEESIVRKIESTRAELKAEIQYVHDMLKDLKPILPI